jgi:aryl-alcohol dehydrogenase-like predicted oxidoreductase
MALINIVIDVRIIQKWVLGEEESLAILKAAWDRGLNTIDTSNNYSNGVSELIIGKFLQKVRIAKLY